MINTSVNKARTDFSVLRTLAFYFQSNQEFLEAESLKERHTMIKSFIMKINGITDEERDAARNLDVNLLERIFMHGYAIELIHTYNAFFSLLNPDDLVNPHKNNIILMDEDENENIKQIESALNNLVNKFMACGTYEPLKEVIDLLCEEFDPMYSEKLNWLLLILAIKNE